MRRVTGGMISSLLAVLWCIPAGQASTLAQGWGRVNMEGSILDTACAIEAGSRDQSIEMSTVPVGQIIRDGSGTARPFTIHLINCVRTRPDPTLPDWQRFQVTFDGESRNGLFQVQGTARGVALQIRDAQGNVAVPGKPLPADDVRPGAMHLTYSLHLVGDKQVLRAGEYRSAIRFKLDYY
ncbi:MULTISPECIES: fimbrial protein [Serratia]|uniref:fimbrial protein n=1 Tax=Serratia TaxID=613 RepID=UPI001F4C09B4|nr:MULTISPECIES: fimbrial protein [Serratia]ULG10893.1 pilin [Serratia entomophila]CAI1948404.1 PAP fimbrial minor pilin protein precursor [Serratia quinivorans]CAI2158888.1 PAP fimbrial minor pilin protein precursor [Serratia quinivorans]